ncbi:hypothetical protein [Pyxidicoccus xibeiensis]|uniref:hypothetical protein n=1 Tax=Pyxidicoccus xibeiensis TaxID=2906759 RepID=UPI0020A6EAAF|nr:hypothetical protein [Pyxidicoccus xibeiensis]MCP3142811.1 hypothetical protein [Pyxidicoccus xibeiensis]
MTAIFRRLALTGLGVALGACATKAAPPTQRYALGMARADYRDYAGAKANPCDAEPRWLSDELTAVNGLLSRFLQDTEAPQQAQQAALLQEATRTLPPVLKVHEGTLAALQQCGFRRSGAFPEIARRGAELLKATQARLAEAPAALEAAALGEARKRWQEEAPQREATARGSWCADKPQVGQALLYYARQDAEGRTEWRFCDGLRVEQPANGAPQLVEPEGLSARDRRRIQPQRYLDAARDFPPEEVDRQPTRVPAKETAPESASGGNG